MMMALLLGGAGTVQGSEKHSVLYGGGPLYSYAGTHRDMIRASGFTTIVLWTIHVHGDGDLVLNDHKIIDNGVYVGRAAWPAEVAAFKTGDTSVSRIEIAVGSWGVKDFETIQSLIAAEGTGPTSILYKNFQTLRNTLPSIDAVSFDDESNYQVDPTVAFAVMLRDLGYQISLCPYTRSTFWRSVYNNVNSLRPGTIDRIDLQCYAGGGGNNPGTWNAYFPGLTVTPGLWCYPNSPNGYTPAQVETKMSEWRGAHNIAGGFMWLLDDMLPHQATYPVSAYGRAINDALAISTHRSEVVTLFQHINFTGWLADFTVGAYTTADIIAAGGLNNDASSLIIKPSYQVTFFDNDNFQGASLVKTANDATLVDDGWNDRLSSMIIEGISAPVARWSFNDGGGSTAADSSGQGSHGVLVNMDAGSWTAGKQCGGLTFDGVDDYVKIPGFKGVSGSLNRTCSAWIKTTKAPGEIITWGNTLTERKWIIRVNETGSLRAEVAGGYIYGTTPINDGKWHHIAVVFENDGTPNITDAVLYVDGLRDTTAAAAPREINTADTNDVAIGGAFAMGPRYFQGQIDEVRVYSRALSGTEIWDMYALHALTSDIVPDGIVDFADFASLAAAWQTLNPGISDLTCDGVVNMDDMAILAEEWLNSIQ
jgi:hypothetical protein